jgi:hypothetical protein
VRTRCVAQTAFFLPLLLAVGCAEGAVAPHEQPSGPSGPTFGIGTTPGFSDWITAPAVFVDPVQEIPDPDGTLPSSLVLRSGITGGTYGYDANGDGAYDVLLTAEFEIVSEVVPLADGTLRYQWTLRNRGSGAVVSAEAAVTEEQLPNTNEPTFPVSAASPLLGTAGSDRLPGTEDDLAEGQTLVHSTVSPNHPVVSTRQIAMNPVATGVRILVPYPDSPTNKEQCQRDGWRAFGFANQGQCVRYVETGKDSRAGE